MQRHACACAAVQMRLLFLFSINIQLKYSKIDEKRKPNQKILSHTESEIISGSTSARQESRASEAASSSRHLAMKAKPTNQVANEQSHSPSPSRLRSRSQFLDFSASHWQLRLLPAVSRVTVEMWVGFSAGFSCNRAGHLIALSAGNEPA